jgi:hypothetical protein
MADTPPSTNVESDATFHRPTTPSARGATPGQDARFAPGALLASRFRIVSLLGTGGMGEVYRADDVKLGQRVALKYIPAQIEPEVLERLYAEVRIGRQVSHPNVCRLYDIVEIDGAHFIAMEYVDGEDLASLLRRIGRLPAEKALSVARDICAGLAAAHDRGVVHRDLKPANIMVDGRGVARITDFGLAAPTEELAGRLEFAGTPAYMSPEQLAGAEVTQRSDIYGLGLVLYELFTGRRLFDGRTVAEIREQHSSSKSRPSSVVEGMDPAVERVILRCLDENPAMRPATVQALIAALPGGDPLQAALDAGETPSPEMVAAAGRVGDLTPRTAWTLLTLLFLALAAATMLHRVSALEGYIGRPKSPEALADRARDLVERIAGTPEPAGSDYNFVRNDAQLRYLAREGGGRAWETLRERRPSPLAFNYRESPLPMAPVSAWGMISLDDPPHVVPGMARVQLDSDGRLISFSRIPPQHSTRPVPGAPYDWSAALSETGIDLATLKEVVPEWSPSVTSDRQVAWTALYAGQEDLPMRIEAAAWRGEPVFFAVIGPWIQPRVPQAPAVAIGDTVMTILLIVTLIVGSIAARRNLQTGRGDRRGAYRLSVAVTGAVFLASASVADHRTALAAEWGLLTQLAGAALFSGLFAWVFYMALEPYVRRRWPALLISSTRLVAGRIRDPLVGRDILIGALAGAGAAAIALFVPLMTRAAGIEPTLRGVLNHISMSKPLAVGYNLNYFNLAVLYSLGWLMLYAMLKRLIRKEPATLMALWVLVALVNITRDPLLDFAVGLLIMAPLMIAFRRVGVLALATSFVFLYVVQWTPLTTDFSQWYALRAAMIVLALVGIAIFAFRVALAGKPAFGALSMEEEVAN